MKRRRKGLRGLIEITAGIILIYMVNVLAGSPVAVVLGLLGLAGVATVWMVIGILKDPYFTDKTFDNQFYLDRDDIRRNGSEGDP